MEFNKKIICIILLSAMFFVFFICNIIFNSRNEQTIEKVISPTEFIFRNGEQYKINDIEVFSPDYTEKNKALATKFGLTEDEAFIIGILGLYWAENNLAGRKVIIDGNNLIYDRFKYSAKLENTPFAIKNEKPVNISAFNRQIEAVRRGKFIIMDLDSDIAYPISKENRKKVKNFVIVRKNYVKKVTQQYAGTAVKDIFYNPLYKSGNIKIIVSDLTTKTLPDRDCSSEICKEIISNIDNAKNTIDIAIYGYSNTPKIERAIEKAKSRGVKIRLIYDLDAKGENIYSDTDKFIKLIPDNVSDKNSLYSKNTMHNKFYIFDEKVVISGSANLSHTDMSGYNSNSIIVICSPEVAKFYTDEFNQMYNGKFHADKESFTNKNWGNIKVFFSPQDKPITNGILPLIRNAKHYIYVPAFVITENRLTSELINAKKRGVDIRIIADALNVSTRHSKHKELRNAGILVKAENYAGKMHSKTMIIDDEYLVIGSMNFSNSGENKNDENVIILQDTGAAKFYKNFFIYQWNRIPDRWLKYNPRAEGVDSVGSCSDGIDNNYDGKIDLADEACLKK